MHYATAPASLQGCESRSPDRNDTNWLSPNMLSSYRPKSLLYIFSKEKNLINQLSLSWGVRAIFYDEEESLDHIFSDRLGFYRKEDL